MKETEYIYQYQVPEVPVNFLEIVYSDENQRIHELKTTCRPLPFSRSAVYSSTILHHKKLTTHPDVKQIYKMKLKVPDDWEYEPGGTIGILPKNNINEIQQVFNQLNVTQHLDTPCVIKNCQNSKKKLPLFVNKMTTLRHIFTNDVDIRCLPKKLFIRSLAEFADGEDKSRLLYLCSREGCREYNSLIQKRTSFIELLLSCPSCSPPVRVLLEHLPPLLPRPYSIASSPSTSPRSINIVFSLECINGDVVKEGLCTGMLKKLVEDGVVPTVDIYLRSNTILKLPENPTTPLIFIAFGTGISPFIGLLEHCEWSMLNGNKFQNVQLFYGCKNEEKDFLFKEELNRWLNCDVLDQLFMSFSQQEGRVKYVQDNIHLHSKELVELIINQNGMVFICGNQKMKSAIMEAFKNVITNEKGISSDEACTILQELQKLGKILQDFWT